MYLSFELLQESQLTVRTFFSDIDHSSVVTWVGLVNVIALEKSLTRLKGSGISAAGI